MKQYIKSLQENVGVNPEKFYKGTLFHTERLLLGINCLEPGQVQKPHDHADQDKFYYVVEGSGNFWLGDEQIEVGAGHVVWAPAGINHGVRNDSDGRLTLLMGIAPGP